MAMTNLPKSTLRQIDSAVKAYTLRRQDFINLAARTEKDLIEKQQLSPLIHSSKRREKDPEHLRDKLLRKACQARDTGKSFSITAKNLFTEFDDLAGVRLLHIHTEQLRQIHPAILEILKRHKYSHREKPVAYIWDSERADLMRQVGLKVSDKKSLYTSVHYVVQPDFDEIGCEIQVRTLAEELWGEVSHTIDYPHPTKSKACREQLAALAHIASGCTRLVDSIFQSLQEHNSSGKKP